MIFNSKQLEELENIHDSTGAFEEEADDDAGFDEVGEAAMDWRRGLIEEAAENIKRAKTRPVEPHLTYPIGSMLFEREARRFARVQRSVPGYLKIVYLSGGDREFGTLDVTGYLRDYGAEKRLSELAEQLGMNDADVAAELERLGITPIEEPEDDEIEVAPAEPLPPPLPRAKKIPVEEESDEEEEVVEATDEVEPPAIDDDDDEPRPAKGKAAAAAKAPKPSPKPSTKSTPPTPAAKAKPADKPKQAERPQEKAGKQKPVEKAKAEAKGGKGINPIDDPNGYIKAHFQELSNRELARLTGLSEHTIRRKLGEWGLKRK